MNTKWNTMLLCTFLFAATGFAAEENSTEVEAEAVAEEAAAKTIKPVDAFAERGCQALSVSYGYVTTDYEDVDSNAEGWRVNFNYEMNPKGGKFFHGVTVGYMETSASRSGAQTVEYEAKSLPIYYAPKIMIGPKMAKIFAKGALGCHFTDYSRSGFGGSASYDEFGFFGGASVGAMLIVKEKIFINAEYEWAYMSNSYFQDGAVESAMVGIGLRL